MQKLTLVNRTPSPLEVYVEVTPDRYILQPKDEFVIEAEPDPPQDHPHLNFFEGGLQINPPVGLPNLVTINGQVAETVDGRVQP
jgi:hypothetical protein